MFTGEYRHSVDDKGRVAVPAKFRVQLDGGAYVARWLDACLAIFPRAAWDELAGKVGGLPIGDANARTFSRALFASAYEVEPDRQGRIVLPASLREAAGLTDRRGRRWCPRPRRDLGSRALGPLPPGDGRAGRHGRTPQRARDLSPAEGTPRATRNRPGPVTCRSSSTRS